MQFPRRDASAARRAFEHRAEPYLEGFARAFEHSARRQRRLVAARTRRTRNAISLARSGGVRSRSAHSAAHRTTALASNSRCTPFLLRTADRTRSPSSETQQLQRYRPELRRGAFRQSGLGAAVRQAGSLQLFSDALRRTAEAPRNSTASSAARGCATGMNEGCSLCAPCSLQFPNHARGADGAGLMERPYQLRGRDTVTSRSSLSRSLYELRRIVGTGRRGPGYL